MTTPGCEARQYNDEMYCAGCGLTWDTNDDDPPECIRVAPSIARETIDNLLRDIK